MVVAQQADEISGEPKLVTVQRFTNTEEGMSDFVTQSNGRDCKHGRLARKCEICEYEMEIDDLKRQLESIEQDTKKLNEYGIAFYKKLEQENAELKFKLEHNLNAITGGLWLDEKKRMEQQITDLKAKVDEWQSISGSLRSQLDNAKSAILENNDLRIALARRDELLERGIALIALEHSHKSEYAYGSCGFCKWLADAKEVKGK